MTRPTLYFQHGWACDASLWTPLRERLADWPQVVADAGYFGAPEVPDTAGPLVAIGHSFGGMALLANPPARCQALILINSFPRFSAAHDFACGIPVRMLDRMLDRLQRHPDAVIADFLARAASAAPPPWPAPGAQPDIDRLRADLQQLRDGDQRAALRNWLTPLGVLASRQDVIAPPALTQAALPAEVQWHDHGDHLLPWSAPDWCAARLREYLHRWYP